MKIKNVIYSDSIAHSRNVANEDAFNSPFGGLRGLKKLIFISLLLACGLSAFGQDSTAAMPDKMISLDAGVNIFSAEHNYKSDIGYLGDISYSKRISRLENINLYINMGVAYKNLNYTYNYTTTIPSTFDTKAGFVDLKEGNGQDKWKEQYLSPVIGLDLLSNLNKHFYVGTSVHFNVNLLISGEKVMDFNGQKLIDTDSLIEYNYHRKVDYKHNNQDYYQKYILSRIEGFFGLGLGYKSNNMSIVFKYQLVIPNYIRILNRNKKHFIGGINFKQNIFTLQLNYFLK